MKTVIAQDSSGSSKESGQAVVLLLLALGIFLAATAAFAVDFTNMWFQREAAQAAADAACGAGIQEMLTKVNNPAYTTSFTVGTAADCTVGSTASPCAYASLNGFSANGLTPGNDVRYSFPTGTCPGPAISTSNPLNNPGDCPAPGVTPAVLTYPFIRVDILRRVEVAFVGLLSGGRTRDVRATATCGIVSVESTVPIAVLAPKLDKSLTVNGSAQILLAGGSSRSIVVNSDSAVAAFGGGNINIAFGAPDYCGGIMSVHGGTSPTPVAGFVTTAGGTTGWTGTLPSCTGTARAPKWDWPGGLAPDGLAFVPPPSSVGLPPGGSSHVDYPDKGCPDPVGGCTYYRYGVYASGINVGGKETAIFEPGVYYITGGLNLNTNSCVRPTSGVPGQTVGGVSVRGTMFYFSDDKSINASGSGGNCDFRSIDPFNTISEKCNSMTSVQPSFLPATISDSVFLAPCLYDETNFPWGDPGSVQTPLPANGPQRGVLFYQNRSQTATLRLGGGTTILAAGAFYSHRCRTDGVDSGTGCVAPTSPQCLGGGANSSSFCSAVELAGNPGSSTFVLGAIITDNLRITGSASVAMSLNPGTTWTTYKASLFR